DGDANTTPIPVWTTYAEYKPLRPTCQVLCTSTVPAFTVRAVSWIGPPTMHAGRVPPAVGAASWHRRLPGFPIARRATDLFLGRWRRLQAWSQAPSAVSTMSV